MKPSLRIKRPVVFSQASRPPQPSRPPAELDTAKVMGRLEWFRDLKTVFSLLQEATSVSVSRQSLVKQVTATRFELQEADMYYSKERSVAFSFQEVLRALQGMQEEVTWDQVIDAIFQIGVNRAKQQARANPDTRSGLSGSQSVTQFAPKAAVSPQHGLVMAAKCPPSTSSNTVDMSFPDDKLTALPEAAMDVLGNRGSLLVSNIQYLNLSGNSLEDGHIPLCQSLILLNLSFNQLTEFELSTPLPNLRLLNLSNNAIRRLAMLQRCKAVQEAYLNHNRLAVIGALCHLDRLALLDLGQNAIAAFEDVATLAVNARLIGLRLKGNPIASRSGYESTIRALLPKVQHLDLPSLRSLSDFEQFGALAFVSVALHTVLPRQHSESISDSSCPRSDSLKRGSAPRSTKRPNRELLSATPPHRQPQQLAFRPSQSAKSTPLSRGTPASSVSDLHDFQRINSPEGPELPRKRSEPDLPRKRSEPALYQVSVRKEIPIIEEKPVVKSDAPNGAKHSRTNQSFEQALSFLTEAEKRLGEETPSLEPSSLRRSSKDNSVSLVTAESIQNAHDRRYGNPVAAMMIGPPATPLKNRQDPTRREAKATQQRSVPKARSVSKSREAVVQVDLGRRFR